MSEQAEQIEALKKLREPFKAHEISLLPKPYKKDSPKGKCDECGGYHGLPAVHLSYVGHAALTKRLLEVDPLWHWEPFSVGQDGLPAIGKDGLWIRLTVCGITRIGFGSADGKAGGDAIKELIGDALRNAGMRFGMALELWHKGDLYDAEELAGLSGEKEPVKSADQIKLEEKEARLAEACEKLAGSIKAIKEGLASESLDRAAESIAELTNEELQSIWTAPTMIVDGKRVQVKNAPFTTKELETLRSSEFTALVKHFKEQA